MDELTCVCGAEVYTHNDSRWLVDGRLHVFARCGHFPAGGGPAVVCQRLVEKMKVVKVLAEFWRLLVT